MARRYAPGTTWLFEGDVYQIIGDGNLNGDTMKNYPVYIYKRIGKKDEGKLHVRMKEDFEKKFLRVEV